MQKDARDSPPEQDRADRHLGRDRRLRRRKDFASVFSGGTRLNAQVLTVVVRPNQVDRPRLGLAIGRRSVPRAVARHRLKRLIRESFRHEIERLRGLDVVVLGRSGIEAMESGRLRRLLARQWERAARIRHPTVAAP